MASTPSSPSAPSKSQPESDPSPLTHLLSTLTSQLAVERMKSTRLLWILPLLLVALVSVNLHAQARLAIYGTGRRRKERPCQRRLERSPEPSASTYGLLHARISDTLRRCPRRSLQQHQERPPRPALAVKLPSFPSSPTANSSSASPPTRRTARGLQYPNDFAYRYVVGSTPPSFPTSTGASPTSATPSTTPPTAPTPKTLSSGLVIRF